MAIHKTAAAAEKVGKKFLIKKPHSFNEQKGESLKWPLFQACK